MRIDPTIFRQTTRYNAVPGLIIISLIALIALCIWVIPDLRRIFYFVPDGSSWIIFWFAISVFSAGAYYLILNISRRIGSGVITLEVIKKTAAWAIMYFAGALLIYEINIVPSIASRMGFDWNTIRFFILYTAAIVCFAYLGSSRVRHSILSSMTVIVSRTSYVIQLSTITYVTRALVLLIVPAIIAAKLQVVPINPDISTWLSSKEIANTIVFFGIYAFILVLGSIIAKPIVELIKYIFRSVPSTEISYQLYGPNIAWWIRLSITFTIIAQFVCFFTAYFGLKLLLSEEGVPSIEVFSLRVPQPLLKLLHLGSETIIWTQLQVISLVVAFLLSAGISYFAAMSI